MVLDDEARALLPYFHDIAASTPLSRQREGTLSVRIQQGDLQARDELVEANLRFVVDIAKQYRNRGLPFGELVSAGNLGLITAAERFDGARGCKFISYAVWWIRQAIFQALAVQLYPVRLPLSQLRFLRHIGKTSLRLSQEHERAPDMEELAAALDVSVEQVVDTLLSTRAVGSLDQTSGKRVETNLLDTLANPGQESPDVQMQRAWARKQVADLLSSLDERESRILRLYFGLDGNQNLSLEQIGKLFHLTRERVRQLKKQALHKLQSSARHPALRSIAAIFAVEPIPTPGRVKQS
jgi:RNA polymerase primary sigma factor